MVAPPPVVIPPPTLVKTPEQIAREASDAYYAAHPVVVGPPPQYSGNDANKSKSQIYAEEMAKRSYEEALWNSTHSANDPYYGPSVDARANARFDAVGVTQRYLDITRQYETQHFANVSTSGTMLPTGPGGAYVYVSGPTSLIGTVFRANVLTLGQQTDLNRVMADPNATVRDYLNIGGLSHMDPAILAQKLNVGLNDMPTSQKLSSFLADPVARKPYEDYLWGTGGGANARTALDAVPIGRGATPMFAMVPGSVNERFGFDEFGKVLNHGEKFEPAYSAEGVPYNPKMGNGDYSYVGEFHYRETGETVSRFVNSIGSFVDVTRMGVFGEKVNAVRSGGSPGAYYETNIPVYTVPVVANRVSGVPISPSIAAPAYGVQNWAQDAWTNMFKGTNLTPTQRSAASPNGLNFNIPSLDIFAAAGGAIKNANDWFQGGATLANTEVFQKIPVLSDVNRAGRVFGVENQINALSKEINPSVEGYQSRLQVYETHLNQFNASGGQDMNLYNQLMTERSNLMFEESQLSSKIGQIQNLQLEQKSLSSGMINNQAADQMATWGIYSGLSEAGKWWKENAVGYYDEISKNSILPQPVAGAVHSIGRGLVGSPAAAAEFIGMVPVGTELIGRQIVANPAGAVGAFAGLAAYGLGTQVKGMYEGMTGPDPLQFVAEQAGVMVLLHYGGKAVKAGSPIGGGMIDVASFEKGGSPTTFVGMYTKTPFAKAGGKPLFQTGFAITPYREGITPSGAWITRAGETGLSLDRSGSFGLRLPSVDYIGGTTGVSGRFGLRPMTAAGEISYTTTMTRAGGEWNPIDVRVFRSPFGNLPGSNLLYGVELTAEGKIASAPFSINRRVASGTWDVGRYKPLEFERGPSLGYELSPAERAIFETRSPEAVDLLVNAKRAQDYLSTHNDLLPQQREYAFRPEAINEQAWNAFWEVTQRPEYKGKIVAGGSTISELFTREGEFRPLKGTTDTDLYIDQSVLRSFAEDALTEMQKHQDNIFMGKSELGIDFETGMEIGFEEGRPGGFSFDVEVGDREITLVEGHTFTEFPNVLEQARPINMAGGGQILGVSPEYSFRSAMAGVTRSFSMSEGLGYRRAKGIPDAISYATELYYRGGEASELFGDVARSYREYLFSEDIFTQARINAQRTTSLESWQARAAEEGGKTIDDVYAENIADIKHYRDIVSGYRDIPAVPRATPGEFTLIPGEVNARMPGGINFRTSSYSFNWGRLQDVTVGEVGRQTSRIRPYVGSPGAILKETGFRVSPSTAVENPWSNMQHAVFDQYLIENLPRTQSEVLRTTAPAVNAAYSRLFTPQQRELYGQVPTKSASRAAVVDILTEWEQFGDRVVSGGSRAQKVWTGEGGRYESMFESDFDTYASNVKTTNKAYDASVDAMRRNGVVNVEEFRGTHPANSPDPLKARASVVTDTKGEFIHIKPFEAYPYMNELPPVRVEAVGGTQTYVINPRVLMKRTTAGIFSEVSQRPGGTPELYAGRPKDIIGAYSISRSFAETLYQPTTVDAGGVLTGARTRRAVALENYSVALENYLRDLGDADAMGMFKEIRRDPLTGVNRSPQPRYDVVSGHGLVPARYEGTYQTGMAVGAATIGGVVLGPAVGLPKVAGAVAGVIFPGTKAGAFLKAGEAKLTGGQLRLYRNQIQLGKLYEESITTTPGEGKIIDYTRGDAGSTRMFSNRMIDESVGIFELTKEYERAHSHPVSAEEITVFGKEIAEDIQLAQSGADTTVMIQTAPVQDVIISKAGAIVYEVPENIRAMDFMQRTEYARGAELTNLLGNIKDSSMKMTADYLLNKDNRLAITPSVEEAMLISRQAEVLLFSEKTGVKVTLVKDINPETGIGRVADFSPDAYMLADRWMNLLEKPAVGKSTVPEYPVAEPIIKEEYPVKTKTVNEPYAIEQPTYEVPKAPTYPTGSKRGALEYPLAAKSGEYPLTLAGLRYPSVASIVEYPSAAAVLNYPAVASVSDYPAASPVTDYPTIAPDYPVVTPGYPTTTPGSAYPITRPYPQYPTAPAYPTVPGYPSYPPTSGYPKYSEPPRYPEYPLTPDYPVVPDYPNYPETPNYPNTPNYPQTPKTPNWPEIPVTEIPLLWVPPTPKKKRWKRKAKKKANEWYIWNPVPTLETVFGTQLNIKELYPQAKQQMYLIGNNQPMMRQQTVKVQNLVPKVNLLPKVSKNKKLKLF